MSSEQEEQERIDRLTTRLRAVNNRREQLLARAAELVQRDQKRKKERDERRRQLAPADYFVSLIAQALPWSKPPEVEFPADPAGPLPKFDHKELRERLEALDLLGAHTRSGAGSWFTFMVVIMEGILEDFTRGELDLDGALSAVRRCAITQRSLEMDAVSHVANRASVISTRRLARGLSAQQEWNKSRGTFPTWFRCVAITLVRVLVRENPEQRVTPTSPVLKAAMDWLETLGVAGTGGKLPSPATVRRWYLTDRRKRGESPGRGRPAKKIARSFY